MPQTSRVIVMQPVLELYACEGFALWPVAESAHDDPPRPAEPLGGFLHGLLTMEGLAVTGGLQITDTATGTTFLPGCCNGLDERLDWPEVLDGDGWASFGHNPAPLAERHGDFVRLTVDAERDDSPVIELPVTELRRLLAGAERHLVDFLHLVATWAALCRALDLPVPGTAALRS
ncbi:hypothetical protein [Streptomyces griseorubiginosus]|uniref:hypothetical protein n=1 Tax=Streptomyces griseorubiginosus TaxID=67304 RepID=UPI0036E57853